MNKAQTHTSTVSADQKRSAVLSRRLLQDQQKNAHKRRFKRHPTFAVANMTILNNSMHFDGVVTEVSENGLKFRPASLFLLEQNGERVSVVIDSVKTIGTIRASRADGYGIQLLEKFDDEALEYLLANYTENAQKLD